MTQRDRTGVEQEFTCWSWDNVLCRGTEPAPLRIYPLLSICSSSKGCFSWQPWIQVLLIWQAQLELLILTETAYLGKTGNAFLFPSPQSLVRRKPSALHPLIHQDSVWQPFLFLREMLSFLPNAICSLQFKNQRLRVEQLICESLG